MKFGVYSVYDDKAKAYITPFFMPTDAMAIREFANMANDNGHRFCLNAEDYTLFRVGRWESDDAQFTDTQTEVLGRALQFKKNIVIDKTFS